MVEKIKTEGEKFALWLGQHIIDNEGAIDYEVVSEKFDKAIFDSAEVKVLDYHLREGYGGNDKVWIQHESGEGGDFSKLEFAKLIEDFYNDNF